MAVLLGMALWIQLILVSSIWDDRTTSQLYLKTFAEAQLAGCSSILLLRAVHADPLVLWASISTTLLYALVRLYGFRGNPLAIVVHFLLFPAVCAILFQAYILVMGIYQWIVEYR